MRKIEENHTFPFNLKRNLLVLYQQNKTTKGKNNSLPYMMLKLAVQLLKKHLYVLVFLVTLILFLESIQRLRKHL